MAALVHTHTRTLWLFRSRLVDISGCMLKKKKNRRVDQRKLHHDPDRFWECQGEY